MSKRKFQSEMDAALAPVLPYLTPEKPRKKGQPAETSFLPHLVPEEHLMKTDKLPLPPVVMIIITLLYFMRCIQPIGYGVAIYILGLKPFVVLMSLQFLIKHSVEVLLLFSSDSPCYLPRIVFSASYK